MRTTKTPARPDPTLTRLDQTLAAVPATAPKAETPKQRRRERRERLAVAAFVLLLALVVAGVWWFTRQGGEIEQRAQEKDRVIVSECTPGGSGVGTPLCSALLPQVEPGASVTADAAGLDSAAVLQLVRAELARGPAPATPADVEGAARRVLTANPDLYRGVPGDAGPTGDPGTPGASGEPGAPGQGPTDEQVRAAAAMVIASDPAAFRGVPGSQGVGVSRIDFDTRDGQCVAVVTLLNPADGSTVEQTAPVGSAVCSSAPPPPDPGPLPGPGPDTGTPAPSTEDSAEVEPTPEATTTEDGGTGVGDLLGG